MMERTHREQVAEALPDHKLAAKRRRTVLGAVLACGGAALSIGAFVLAAAVIDADNGIDKWATLFVGLPFLAGFLLALIGAHVASGELVGAALRDIRDTVAVWRRT